MFLPGRNAEEERQALQKEYRRVETICLELLPADPALREASTISVQEVQCGDPECAPIDTIVTIMFPRWVLKWAVFRLDSWGPFPRGLALSRVDDASAFPESLT